MIQEVVGGEALKYPSVYQEGVPYKEGLSGGQPITLAWFLTALVNCQGLERFA
jgi:hypothetical protein